MGDAPGEARERLVGGASGDGLASGDGGDRSGGVVSLVAHFLVGPAKSLVRLRTWWSAGLEMTLAGIIVGGATFIVGLALLT